MKRKNARSEIPLKTPFRRQIFLIIKLKKGQTNEVSMPCHGFQVIDGKCSDIDMNECEDSNPCGDGGVCQNTIGSFE